MIVRYGIPTILSALVCLSGCTNSLLFHPTIMQGIPLTDKQISSIQVGMTKAQVLNTLGSPTLQDPFHAHRWDYWAGSSYEEKLTVKQHIVLEFDDESTVKQIHLVKR
ncbi:MAG: outer membrane protein assembly factor BamE [Pseudomonadota bacterium]